MPGITFKAEPGTQDTLSTRPFDAPRERLFKALTDPDLIPKWWTDTTVEKLEARPGGIWRYVSKNAQGFATGFHGVYHEVESPERLVYTFEAEGMPGHVQLVTVTLEERGGKTMLTQHSVFQSTEDREALMQYGMEKGAGAGMDRLEAVVAAM
jgi:uncharacterized protein YndB with AHSA1/START domain